MTPLTETLFISKEKHLWTVSQLMVLRTAVKTAWSRSVKTTQTDFTLSRKANGIQHTKQLYKQSKKKKSNNDCHSKSCKDKHQF